MAEDIPVVVDAPIVPAPVVDAPVEGTLLGDAGGEPKVEGDAPKVEVAPDAAVLAENKRLLEADDASLTADELVKKQELVKAETDAKANTVPDVYEVKIDGVEMNADLLGGLSPIFKEMNLTNAQVQKLAEAYTPIVKAQVEAQQKAAIESWNKQGEDWKAESIKMLGANAKTEMPFAAKFMDRFGGKVIELEGGKKTNELRVLMEDTKIGNNPIMLRAIIAAGRLLGEDKFVEGNNDGKGGEPSLYDHPTSKETLLYK